MIFLFGTHQWAEPCKAIFQNRELVYEYTNTSNTIAIISDGTRILGLGNIGPEAGQPVVEGKALLFKYLGGIDAILNLLAYRRSVRDYSYGKNIGTFIWRNKFGRYFPTEMFSHSGYFKGKYGSFRMADDQQGTAMIGMGAAKVATYRLI